MAIISSVPAAGAFVRVNNKAIREYPDQVGAPDSATRVVRYLEVQPRQDLELMVGITANYDLAEGCQFVVPTGGAQIVECTILKAEVAGQPATRVLMRLQLGNDKVADMRASETQIAQSAASGGVSQLDKVNKVPSILVNIVPAWVLNGKIVKYRDIRTGHVKDDGSNEYKAIKEKARNVEPVVIELRYHFLDTLKNLGIVPQRTRSQYEG